MTLSGIEPATFRFVAQHLNHCAIAVPTINIYCVALQKSEDHLYHFFHCVTLRITITFASEERLVSGDLQFCSFSEDSDLLSCDVWSLGCWFPTFRRTSAFIFKTKVNSHQLSYPRK